MRDDPKGQCFRVVCRTLYDVRLKKRVQIPVERFHKINYQQLWIIFGISIVVNNKSAATTPSA